ncbi:unnamed protein product, partial [Callosobruchus maculatus]
MFNSRKKCGGTWWAPRDRVRGARVDAPDGGAVTASGAAVRRPPSSSSESPFQRRLPRPPPRPDDAAGDGGGGVGSGGGTGGSLDVATSPCTPTCTQTGTSGGCPPTTPSRWARASPRSPRLAEKHIVVTFFWAKAHIGIQGNVKIVDQAAKNTCQIETISEGFILPSDITYFFKRDIFKKWKEEWSSYCSLSVNHYTKINPSVPVRSPHIFEYQVNRFYSSTITRLRLNHSRFKAHLYKIGIENSPNCICDGASIADLNHIFFACENNKIFINSLINRLILEDNIYPPFNISNLLALTRKSIHDKIV